MQTSKRIFAFAVARCEQASRITQIITVALKRVTVPAKQRTERARPCRHLSCLSLGLRRERQRKQWSLRWTRRSHWSICRREFIYIMYKSLKSRAEGSFTLRKSEPKEERFVNCIKTSFVRIAYGFNAIQWCCLHVTSKRSKVPLSKMAMLMVRANKP